MEEKKTKTKQANVNPQTGTKSPTCTCFSEGFQKALFLLFFPSGADVIAFRLIVLSPHLGQYMFFDG